MTAALPLLPPVIDQTIEHVGLTGWSATGFALVLIGSMCLAWRRSPWIGALLAFVVPFAAYRDIGQTTVTIEKCVVVGASLGLLMSGLPLWPQSRGTRRILLAGAAVLVTIALSSVNAIYHLNVVRELFKQAEYLALLWCAAIIAEQIARSRAYFVGGVAVSALIVSTLAVAQAVIGGAPSGVWLNGHPIPRVAGTIEGPNQLAGFLEAVLPVMWVWPMLATTWNPLRNYVIAASQAALVLTQSRGGLLVCALSFIALWRMRGDVARKSLPALMAGASFGVLVGAAWLILWAHASFADFRQIFFFSIPGQPGGVGTRAELWPAAIDLFRQHPLFGVGAANFELLLQTVGLHGIQTHAGSLWLQTLAEQGLVGFLALAVFAFVTLRETYAVRHSPLGLAAFLAIASLLTHQIVDDLFFFPKVASLCYLLLGVGTAQELGAPLPASRNGRATIVDVSRETEPLERRGASDPALLPD